MSEREPSPAVVIPIRPAVAALRGEQMGAADDHTLQLHSTDHRGPPDGTCLSQFASDAYDYHRVREAMRASAKYTLDIR